MNIRRLFKAKYYWYQVKYRYSNKNGITLFDWYSMIGLKNKSDILNTRNLKKMKPPLHKNTSVCKRLLCNGYFNVEIHCYLGRFRNND